VPVTVILPLSEPRRPTLMLSPTRAVALGSPTMAKSKRCPHGLGPGHQLVGAVDRVGFLVIGDGERDGAFVGAAIGNGRRHGRDEGSDAGLHVGRTATVDRAIDDLGGEGRMSPGSDVAGRHHVGMPGEQQVPANRAARREEVVDRVGSIALEAQRWQRESEREKRASSTSSTPAGSGVTGRIKSASSGTGSIKCLSP
jgi:hypothetical protein